MDNAVDAAELEDRLVRFATGLRWDAVPAATQERVRDLWLDAIANAVAGRDADTTRQAEAVLRRLTGDGDSTVLGGAPAAELAAVHLNGHQITVLTMCDVYRPALCHITPVVVPVVVAVAEQLPGVTGEQVLTAFTVGLEVTARLGLAIDYPTFRARGWHSPGVIGPFGAAAAAGHLLGFDEDTLRGAFGLAGSQASGTFAALGTSAVKFHQARGATSGLLAARFAAGGLGGTPTPLSHTDGGLLTTWTDGGDPAAGVDGLGERFELEQIAMRRWPASSSLQTLIEAALAARERVDPADVDELVVHLPAASYAMCAAMGWGDALEAMQSARYVAATVLREGRCWLEQYGDGARSDHPTTRFATERVRVECDPDLPPAGVVLDVRRHGRSHLEVRRDIPRGDPRNPLTRADIEDKLASALDTHPTGLVDGDVAGLVDGDVAGSVDGDVAGLSAFDTVVDAGALLRRLGAAS